MSYQLKFKGHEGRERKIGGKPNKYVGMLDGKCYKSREDVR